MSDSIDRDSQPISEATKARVPAARPEEKIRAEAAITIMAPVDVVYRFYRDLRNMPLFTPQLESVEVSSPTRSHWTWKALKNRVRLEWDAEITEEIPSSTLTWKSVGDSDVEHSGRAWFAELPAGRGTVLRVRVDYDPPGGQLTDKLELFFGENPRWSLSADLKRLRALIECGEIPTIEGQPRGGASAEESQNPNLH